MRLRQSKKSSFFQIQFKLGLNMKYISQALQKDENIFEVAKFHWFYTAWAIIVFTMFFLIGLMVRDGSHPDAAYFFWLFGVIRFLTSMIFKWTTEIAITDRRIVYKTGWIRRDIQEMGVKKLEEIKLKQGVFGRIFGYGKLIINGTGSGKIDLPNIDSPLNFKTKIQESINI